MPIAFRLGPVLGFAFAGARAFADDAPAAAAPPEISLIRFGSDNPACQEWTDGCAVCLRDSGGVIHCSVPGIACQPSANLCRREAAQ